jgi:hypothetical protein
MNNRKDRECFMKIVMNDTDIWYDNCLRSFFATHNKYLKSVNTDNRKGKDKKRKLKQDFSIACREIERKAKMRKSDSYDL